MAAGVLAGINVLDLSWGIAGPVATMLLADHGAAVTRIEPPGGDPFRGFSGSQVWARSKRSAVLDLTTAEHLEAFLKLASTADVVVESFAPGTTAKLGIDDPTLRALNPRLIYCSITGYGDDGQGADRPGLDALVAARTGQQWEHRGLVGGTIERLSGGSGIMPGLEPPEADCWVGPPREGPLFGGVAWSSMATSLLATLAINAAIRERERSGLGQHVHASLLQGVLANTIGPWQRAERYDTPAFQSWIIDPRAPKGFFRAADGRWTHHWVPLPSFVLGVSQGGELALPTEGEDSAWAVSGPKKATLRVGVGPEDMIVLHTYNAEMRDAVARFPSQEWIDLAAQVGVPVQPVRSPEEALLDPDFLADGCVIEVVDPDLGPVRQVGSVVRLSACPTEPPRPPALVGEHTAAVLAEAAATTAPRVAHAAAPPRPAPLAGVRVIDLGLAVAGPYGTQLLSDLGADVIKVNTLHDGYWFGTHVAMCCNRGKRSISLDLKKPEALEALTKLIRSADIVQHNMRYDAAVRLGVDYETLRAIKPDLIYCHTRGFEHGWRNELPGNDQTGAALAGTEWLDGGLDDDGKPIWSVLSLGDTGNGLLSAVGIVQALYHRDRTGEGQFVDTSITYAHLLNASMSWVTADGRRRAARPSLDAMQLGWSALYGLYDTADGWLCLAATDEVQWASLCAAIGRSDLGTDQRFTDTTSRRANDRALRDVLADAFTTRTAHEWFTRLDAAGVHCEVSDPDFVLSLFDDPEMRRRKWVASYRHGIVGEMVVAGLGFDLDGSPGVIQGPAPVVGANTAELLAELGYSEEEIAGLLRGRVAHQAGAPT